MVSSVNKDGFYFFLVQWLFISFSCLIALTRNSITVLNRSDESGHSCLISDLQGKAFSISSLNRILGFFVDVVYQAEEVPVYS